MKQKLQLYLERPISFYPQLAKIFGGIEEALFVQQLYYWSDKGGDEDGWIYKTKNEWEEETTIKHKKLDAIVKKLKQTNILQTKLKKVQGAPTLHYKLDTELLQKSISDYPPEGHSDSPPEGYSKVLQRDIPTTESTTETTSYTQPGKNKFLRGELKEKEQPKTKNPNEGESTRQPSGTNNSFRYSEKNSSDSFESVIDLDSGDFVDEKPKSHAKYPNARTIFALFDHPEPGWKINTTELKSAELLYLKGIKNVMGALRFFKDYRDEEMCPQIYKPSDLERKWKNLVHFRAKLGV